MKALFVGLGSIGQRHLRNLKRLHPADLHLTAYRARGGRGLLDDFGRFDPTIDPADYHGVKIFHSLAEALEEGPDITIVANPTALHLDAATAAVGACSHVLIEKPLSHSSEGVVALATALREQKVVGSVAYQFRFHPALVTAKAWLEQGRVGRIVSAHLINGEYMPGWHSYEDYRGTYASSRSLGGGAIATQSHELDYAFWLFGAPHRVYASGGHLSDLDIDVEDVAALTLQCGDAARTFPVTVNLDYLQRPASRRFTIVGTNATMQCDLVKAHLELTETSSGRVESVSWPAFQRNDMYLDMLRSFLRAVATHGTPPVPVSEALTTMRTIDAAHASLASGQAVAL